MPAGYCGGSVAALRQFSMCLVCLMIALAAGFVAPLAPAQAATAVDVMVTEEPEGYARMVFTFPQRATYKVEIISGVLVVSFDEEMSAQLNQTTLKAPSYISVGRVDPDGRAFRFALAQTVRVNTLEAGEQVFLDLLPVNWSGLAPGLPAEVIAELARRAADAEEAATRESRRLALEASQYRLRIRVGEHPTFSRIVFDWGAHVGVNMARSGNTITVAFDQFAVVPMDRLKVDPPRYVVAAEQLLNDTGVSVAIDIEQGTDVRGFREENTYVVDILAPRGVIENDNSPAASLLPSNDLVPATALESVVLNSPTEGDAAADDVGNEAAMDEREEGEPETTAEASMAAPVVDVDQEPTPAPEQAIATEQEPIQRQEPDADVPPDEVPDVIISEFYLNDNATGLASETDEALVAELPAVAPQSDAPNLVAPDGEPDTAAEQVAGEGAESSEPTMPSAMQTGPVQVSATRHGETVRIEFPFGEAVATAVFTRSQTLWVIFDTLRPLDLGALEDQFSDRFSDYEMTSTGEAHVLRFRLRDGTLASAAGDERSWTLNIGDLLVTPASPISLKRGLRSDGRAKITVEFQDVGSIHLLRDPELGDRLTVVTGFGPQRGFINPQDFVEFSVLPTAHGLAVKPLTDDLAVRLMGDSILITKPGGLTLSSGQLSHVDGEGQFGIDATRPGFVDYEAWASEDRLYLHQVRALEAALVSVDESRTLSVRLDLARLYLANNLGSEALGQLALIRESDPELDSDPMYLAMRGIANVLMHRPDEAREFLSAFSLSEDLHSALWRGVMDVQDSNWPEAMDAFRASEQEITEYPPAVQARFRVAAARAAIESGDFATADVHLQQIPDENLPASAAAEIEVLQARLFDGLGRSEEALELLANARQSGDRKAEAEARFHHTLIAERIGVIDAEQAVEELEALAVAWRGDDLELNTLRLLADQYVAQGEFRRSLEVMKVAVTNHPDAALARDVHIHMTEVFDNLFLDNTADAMRPIDALALYYEFRELTPVGRRGDEMIRNLADRLIDVDLLDQAAEILNHQVDKRLIGAARAQVAAKLAMVHLMNREPSEALQVLRRTRQAVLPQHVQMQRRLIEARALSELNQTDAAIDLLANVDGDEALRERAEAYWKGERWQAAGETFERVLGAGGGDVQELSDQERIDVLRAAISYVLADDRIGSGRLRARYLTAMKNTVDEHAFEVVTGGFDRDGIAFRNLAREIASIDTLEAFLENFSRSLEAPMVGADASASAG